MELNTSQPRHSEIIAKPARKPVLLLVISFLLIVFTVLGLVVWRQNQEINSTLGLLADAEKRLEDSLGIGKDKSADSEKPVVRQAMATLSEDEQKTAATTDSSHYICALANFGCDKVTQEVTKFQPVTETDGGFAVVVATHASGEKRTLWLKHVVSGEAWIVIYDGETPTREIIDRFAVPADFVAAN